MVQWLPRVVSDDREFNRTHLVPGLAGPQGSPDGLAAEAGDFREAEWRLLTFLLRYYRGAAEAEKLARFPAQSQVFIDRRAIIVHAHLGQGYLPDTRTSPSPSVAV